MELWFSSQIYKIKPCRHEKKNVEKKTQLMPSGMLHQTVLKLRNEIVLAHGQGISEEEY